MKNIHSSIIHDIRLGRLVTIDQDIVADMTQEIAELKAQLKVATDELARLKKVKRECKSTRVREPLGLGNRTPNWHEPA